MMTKEDLIIKLEKEIVLTENLIEVMVGETLHLKYKTKINTISWILKDIKNLNVNTVKREKECDNPHCIDGVVGESYGEKIYCGVCNPHF